MMQLGVGNRLGEEAALPAWAKWSSRILFALAGLALIGQFLVYVHYAVSLFRFPFDYDQGEGFELYDVVLHTQGTWPYQDSQVFPFYTSIYPPLYHLLTAPLVLAFGPALWTGRAVSFAGSLAAAAAIACAVRRETGQGFLGALCGLSFLASNYTFAIGPLFRQHMTMVMFETLAIVTLAQVNLNREDARLAKTNSSILAAFAPLWFNKRLLLGCGLLLAAGYTKQLALATVLAALAWLFLRGPRRALLIGLSMSLVAGSIFLWINWRTDGWWYVSIIQANINAFDIPQMLAFYREWLELHAVLALAAFGYLIYETYWSRLSIYSVWFAFAFANGALSGKFGAGESYFVTATAAACVLAGLAAGKLWNVSPQRHEERKRGWRSLLAFFASSRFKTALALALPMLFLIQTRLTLHTYTEGPVYEPLARVLGVADNSGRGYYDSQGYTQLGPRPARADHEAGYRIAALARNAPGPVFSEEAAFLFAAGKPVVTNAFPQLVMFQAGLFDPTRLIEMITRREFGLVILRAQFYPEPVLQAIGAHYRPLTEIEMNGFTYRLLEPRP
jgi:4-amino-4-deoxy-L-arabinose transferase-like glycosyltransferase